MMIILNLRNTASHGVNRISRNALIAVPLKYFSNFWSSLEMLWNNCKLELTLKCTKYCVLSAAGGDNVNGNVNNNANSNNIIFTIKDLKLSVSVVTARENQKLSNVLNKGFERSVYWNECKTKWDNKNTTNEFRCFLKSNFVGVNRLFILVYSNQGNDSKIFKARTYLPKGIIKNYNVIRLR